MSLKKYKIKKLENTTLIIFVIASITVFTSILLFAFWQTKTSEQENYVNQEITNEGTTITTNTNIINQTEVKNINQTQIETKASISFSQPVQKGTQTLAINCLSDNICTLEDFTRNYEQTELVGQGVEVEDYAAGDITIHNDSSEALNLAIQSRLLSDSGILFRTQERKTVPAHSTIEVYCQADVKGAQGNIEPSHFTLVALPLISQKVYYGTTDEPMTGGVVSRGIVQRENVDQIKNQMLEKFNAEYEDFFTQTESADYIKLTPEPDVTKETVNPAINTETGQFTLTMTITKDYLTFDQQKLEQYLAEREITADYQVSEPEIDLDNNSVLIKVTTQAEEAPELDLKKIKSDLVGKIKIEAEKYLTDLGMQEVSIEYQEDKLPNDDQQIEIKLK